MRVIILRSKISFLARLNLDGDRGSRLARSSPVRLHSTMRLLAWSHSRRSDSFDMVLRSGRASISIISGVIPQWYPNVETEFPVSFFVPNGCDFPNRCVLVFMILYIY